MPVWKFAIVVLWLAEAVRLTGKYKSLTVPPEIVHLSQSATLHCVEVEKEHFGGGTG